MSSLSTYFLQHFGGAFGDILQPTPNDKQSLDLVWSFSRVAIYFVVAGGIYYFIPSRRKPRDQLKEDRNRSCKPPGTFAVEKKPKTEDPFHWAYHSFESFLHGSTRKTSGKKFDEGEDFDYESNSALTSDVRFLGLKYIYLMSPKQKRSKSATPLRLKELVSAVEAKEAKIRELHDTISRQSQQLKRCQDETTELEQRYKYEARIRFDAEDTARLLRDELDHLKAQCQSHSESIESMMAELNYLRRERQLLSSSSNDEIILQLREFSREVEHLRAEKSVMESELSELRRKYIQVSSQVIIEKREKEALQRRTELDTLSTPRDHLFISTTPPDCPPPTPTKPLNPPMRSTIMGFQVPKADELYRSRANSRSMLDIPMLIEAISHDSDSDEDEDD